MAPEPGEVAGPQAVASETIAPRTASAWADLRSSFNATAERTLSSSPFEGQEPEQHTSCACYMRNSIALQCAAVPRPSPVRDRVRDLVLSGSLHAWTIEELLARVRKDVATADYSTVFRAVSFLEEKNLIRRVDIGDGRGRFETADRHHDHVQCERCGRISESGTRCLLENAAEKVSKATGYKILSHHLVFTGLCPECAAAR
jgi:Fe2+ or Zn2+ uptake regulation protein